VDPDRLIEGLDPAQRTAVTTPSPLLAVIASAGSGKTSVLTRRVAYRIATGRADPQHSMVLTFTRQAASELRRRLRGLGLRDQIAAGTFHAMALGMLRQHWADRGRPTPGIVSDRARFVAEALGRRSPGRASEVASEIDWARARLVTPERYAAAARAARRRTSLAPGDVAQVYADYERLKRRRGVVDLDDLLSLVLAAADDDPGFRAAMAWKVRHLYVDEAQDLNPLQAQVLELWRAERDDLTLVGDPAQAIYSFNGADPGLLLDVGDRFAGIEILRLDTNYRCTPEVVAAGRHVLSCIAEPPPVRSARPEGAPVTVLRFPDETAEAAGIAALVRTLRPPGGQWSSIAVLARTNAQLPPILAELHRRRVPARLGSQRLPPGLADAVAEAAARSSPQALVAWAHDVLHTPLDASDVSDDRRRVALAVVEFADSVGGDGRAFAAWVRAATPFTDDHDDAVELVTFHSAKGREWARVVVCGADEGLVPHGSATSPDQQAEEARLAYVAFTRAADQLVITGADRRGDRDTRPSPYLDGLPTSAPVAPPPGLPRTPPAPSHDPVLDAMHAWRSAAARAAGVAPGLVLPDAVLMAIAAQRPTSIDELADVPGVGRLMANRFGPRLLEVLRAAQSEVASSGSSPG
jgi:DNA helicase-2/ATP-dependent DNA helicase PcrA